MFWQVLCRNIYRKTLTPQQNGTANEHLSSLNARRILKAIPRDHGYVFVLLPLFKCRTSSQWNLIPIYPQPWPCSSCVAGRAEPPCSWHHVLGRPILLPSYKNFPIIKTAQSHFKALYRDINSLNIVWKEKHERMLLHLLGIKFAVFRNTCIWNT